MKTVAQVIAEARRDVLDQQRVLQEENARLRAGIARALRTLSNFGGGCVAQAKAQLLEVER
jgi:hypothetical protein